MGWFNFSLNDFSFAFLSVLFEGIAFLLLGSLISGFVDVFVSSERITRLLPKNPVAAIAMSGLLGLIFPICECGSVVVVRRFIRKGVPLSCATTYMLAAPIVSPIVAFSTWQAFSKSDPLLMTLLRLGIGYAVAVGVGLVVVNLPQARVVAGTPRAAGPARRRIGLRVSPREEAAGEAERANAVGGAEGGESADNATWLPARDFAAVIEKASVPRKMLLAVQSATADFLDVAFFFVIGVAITSVFNTAVRQDVLLPLATSPLLSIISLMGLAGLLALCSTTDAFVAWTFTAFSPQAKLAFMVFGPMFDLKLFWLYSLIFKRRFVAALGIGLFVVIALLCWRLPAAIFG